ncbi:hypothetical protein ACKTEK_02270 [Tepidamorphus sp. 3E244]|uniref:hypothetical protein n=1 Tax=Tepidamorphus sp. 3E244 TaxID=3385498 RepID=UPI0038FC6ADA
MDIPKFLDLVISKNLWLSNAEVLAADDPYEGLPDAYYFPHRIWNSIDDLPKKIRDQIEFLYASEFPSKAEIFKNWYRLEEQMCLFKRFSRRQFYVNSWHAAQHESIAMWKIYASPGDGVAVITTGGRLTHSLDDASDDLHVGAVKYWTPGTFQVGSENIFSNLTVKRSSYSFEQEVRIVYWDNENFHDPLQGSVWNEETLRYENINENVNLPRAGRLIPCDINIMIEKVVISPNSPSWYLPMIEKLIGELGLKFPVMQSSLLQEPPIIK